MVLMHHGKEPVPEENVESQKPAPEENIETPEATPVPAAAPLENVYKCNNTKLTIKLGVILI